MEIIPQQLPRSQEPTDWGEDPFPVAGWILEHGRKLVSLVLELGFVHLPNESGAFEEAHVAPIFAIRVVAIAGSEEEVENSFFNGCHLVNVTSSDALLGYIGSMRNCQAIVTQRAGAFQRWGLHCGGIVIRL